MLHGYQEIFLDRLVKAVQESIRREWHQDAPEDVISNAVIKRLELIARKLAWASEGE